LIALKNYLAYFQNYFEKNCYLLKYIKPKILILI